jgi:hypothetical protein
MESNMSFSDITFKGQINMSGVPIFNHDGAPFTVGGYISEDNTETAYFGRVVSSLDASPRAFLLGISGSQKIVGILQNDYAINSSSPFKANYILPKLPATAIFFGLLWLGEWTYAGTGTHETPLRGDVVIFKNDTGQIEFLPPLTAVPSGYSLLDASVMDYDSDTNKVLLFMGIANAATLTGATPEVLEDTTFQINNTGSAIPGLVLMGDFTTAISTSGSFTEVDARAAKLAGSVANAVYGDGYGFVESELTITGTSTGHIAALTSWINIPSGTHGAGGNFLAAQNNGIYEESAATITGALVVFGMRMQCILVDTDAGGIFPFSINVNGVTTTALFQCNIPATDLGLVTDAGSDNGTLVPFYKDAGGNIGYVKIYAHS